MDKLFKAYDEMNYIKLIQMMYSYGVKFNLIGDKTMLKWLKYWK